MGKTINKIPVCFYITNTWPALKELHTVQWLCKRPRRQWWFALPVTLHTHTHTHSHTNTTTTNTHTQHLTHAHTPTHTHYEHQIPLLFFSSHTGPLLPCTDNMSRLTLHTHTHTHTHTHSLYTPDTA